MRPTAILHELYRAASAAAHPRDVLPKHLPPQPRGRTMVLGVGKAAASMAQAVESHWRGALSGMVITRYGHQLPTRFIEVVQSSHPVPDEAGMRAARRMLTLIADQQLTADDLVLCLISGGGSALLPLPAPGLTLTDLQQVNQQLLQSGMPISEMNVIRKHLSAIQGGRLAAACAPAQVVSLIISDVPGDDAAIIASGPTVADTSTFADARAFLAKYDIQISPAVRDHLERATDETPKPDDPRLARATNTIIITPRMALQAAAQRAEQLGIRPLVLGDSIEGEARDVAVEHGAIVRQIQDQHQPLSPPCVVLSGGETTVTVGNGPADHGVRPADHEVRPVGRGVRPTGRGGRNCEFILALALALQGRPHVHALACDTDGIDGTEDNAGAFITPDTLSRAAAAGLQPQDFLDRHDSYSLFATLNNLLVTGPTHTNVNDFRAILITQ